MSSDVPKHINENPMKMGKILDLSANFIFKNIVWISIIGFFMALPELLFQEWKISAESTYFIEILILKMISIVISIFTTPILIGAITILIGERYYGHQIVWYQGLKKSVKKIFPIIALLFLLILGCTLGIVLFLIPGVIALCATACAIPAMLLENLRPIQALKRSWNLTKKSRLRIFGYFLVNLMFFICISIIAPAIGNAVSQDSIYSVGITALLTAPFYGVWPAVATFLFLDLRIRKEAIDLEEEANAISVSVEKAA